MVVVDSSALIPLAKTGNLKLIMKTFKKVKTTTEIYKEVVEEGKGKTGTSEIKQAFEEWIETKEIKNNMVDEISKLEGIEKADASIILLAEHEKEILLSNDRALIQAARAMGVECYWLTTLLLKCTKEKHITKKEAKEILYSLVEEGMNLRSGVYAKILKEIDKL